MRWTKEKNGEDKPGIIILSLAIIMIIITLPLLLIFVIVYIMHILCISSNGNLSRRYDS